MRKPLIGRGRMARGSALGRCILGIERLEGRLALSHAPADYESVLVDHIHPATDSQSLGHQPIDRIEIQQSRSDEVNPPGQIYSGGPSASPGYDGSAGSIARSYSPVNSFSLADSLDTYQPPVQIVFSRPLQAPTEVRVVLVVFVRADLVILPQEVIVSQAVAAPQDSRVTPGVRTADGAAATGASATGVPAEYRSSRLGGLAPNVAGDRAPQVFSLDAEASARSPHGGSETGRENRAATMSTPNPPAQMGVATNVLNEARTERAAAAAGLDVDDPARSSVERPADSESRAATSAGAAAQPSARSAGAPDATANAAGSSGKLFSVESNRRAALLASLPFHVEAIDEALGAMVDEVERLGDELASWFDEASLPRWAAATTLVGAAGFGVRYLRLGKERRSLVDESDEESSAWLFTRLHAPLGTP